MSFPGPAALQGASVSDRDEEPKCGEQSEIKPESSDPAGTDDLASERDFKVPPSDESAERLPAGPATLWGILQSDAELAERDKPDMNTMIDLWRAAGYDCPSPSPDEEERAPPSPASVDATPSDTAKPIIFQSPQAPNPPLGPYTIAASPGKGLGVFASLPLTKGSLILTDSPILAIQKPYTDHSILRHFETLPLPTRLQYMSLFCPDRSGDISATTDVVRIFDANSFAIGAHAAIFLTATRFNHSCVPNAYYSWNARDNRIELHAMVDVPCGEELTICYCHPFLTRQERTAELRMYDFRCSCPACDVSTPFGQESEARRLEMRDLEGWISTYYGQSAAPFFSHHGPTTNAPDGLSPALLRLVSLVKDEGLHGELMNPYRDLADHLKSRGEFAEALAFARLELEEEVVCLGEGSEVVRSTRAYIADLETAVLQKEGEETREGG